MKAIAILFGIASIPAVTFFLGMRVGLNDGLALASIDADSDRIASMACGPKAWVAKRGAERLCVYINPDQSAVIRTVFNRPVGDM